MGAVVTREGDERSRSLQASARYLAAAGGCVLAGLLNPYGYHLYAHLVEYFRDPFPARTTITNCLPPTLRYEIEVVAVKRQD